MSAGPLFAAAGEPLPASAVAIVLEDGAEVQAGRRVRPGVPHGYHRLRLRNGAERDLVIAPRTCFESPDLHGWGWAAQLYATRSRRSWAMGDLTDLAALCAWARRCDAGVVQINPLHAVTPGSPQEPSPYFPSSRLFRNPLYLDVERVPGAAGDREIAALAADARRLNAKDCIDHDAVFSLKMRALARVWGRFTGDHDFAAYCERSGETLRLFASFCVLTERLGRSWRSWPEQYRHPQSRAVARVLSEGTRRVNFHRWLQWLLEQQLDAASRDVMVMHDLAVGFSPDGADAWLWQDLLADGMRIGAPPDTFNTAGQNWGVPPFDPHRLRKAGFAPFRETIRAAMRRDGAIRIDHVMGLFRQWWMADGADPRDGVYVRYPSRELLDIVAIESQRARCTVVGEDLGTVEAGVRPELQRRGMLTYRVAWFEDRPPLRYPAASLAMLTTHDLPTVAGVWTGADELEMEEYAVAVNHAAEHRVRRRLLRLTGARPRATLDSVIVAAHASLSRAPSALVLATLDDAAASARRPNLPGVPSRPNWCLPLPRTLDQLRRDPLPRRIAEVMARGR
ncbi:MAG: 4-alpha-glucanotransferase [Candidatus Dormibacteraeota bacterium]|nr:4-alpha-glucanotransferase [Candidatus Dormibacteraeota bacterium]